MKFQFLKNCIKQYKLFQPKCNGVILNQNFVLATRNTRKLSIANETFSSEIKAIECPNKWIRAIANADKVLEYPNLFMFYEGMVFQDIAFISQNIRKIYGSSHPVLRAVMNLIYDGQNNIQSRGLIALLMAKTIGIPPEQQLRSNDINNRQKATARVIQLVHYGTEIHKTVIDNDKTDGDSLTYDELENGNKVTILLGDFLLAKAFMLIKEIQNTEVKNIINASIGDIMKSEFVYESDKQGNPRPFRNTGLSDWEVHSYLTNGSILANGCKSMAIIAQVDQNKHETAFEFGKQLGLAWKASDDIRELLTVSRYPSGMRQFSLVSCPVILQLQKDPDRLDFVYTCTKNGNTGDFKKIHEILSSDSEVFKGAREICEKHKRRALDLLQEFPESTYKLHLENVVSALGVN